MIEQTKNKLSETLNNVEKNYVKNLLLDDIFNNNQQFPIITNNNQQFPIITNNVK
jgi:hypothetical protein